MKRIEGRIAVVTGAGNGIGRAAALELARRGCDLALVDVSGPALEGTREAVEAIGRTASVHLADVSDAARMATLAEEVVAVHGACHILVNNAGVLSIDRFEQVSIDDIRWLVDVNVFGVLHGCHYFLPVLRRADEAHIVNVSSMAGIVGIPRNAVYSLTKGGVRSFTEALRAELVGLTIGVSALFPGSVTSDIMDRARGAYSERLSAFSRTRISRLLGRSPEAAGRQIVKAIERDRARVLLGPDVRTLDVIARILPGRTGLMGRALDRFVKS
jgi:short-subunit dehydrogenase